MKQFREFFSELNPILIKEMRQYFHNKILLGEMALLLIAQLLVAISFSSSSGRSTGLVMMCVAMGIMAFCGFLLCGCGGMTRFCTERSCPDLDYSKITTLKPFKFIWGKFVAALVMVLFLYALCLPFMVVAYFFRGVDLLQGLLLACIMLPLILLMSLLGLLLGSGGNKKLYAVYVLVLMIGPQCLLGLFSVLFFSRSAGLFGGGVEIFVSLSVFILFCIIGGVYLFSLCMASIYSVSENRMRPFRKAYLAVMLFNGILIPLLGWAISRWFFPDALKFSLGISFGISMANFTFLLFIGCCERLESGSRVWMEAKKGFWGNKWSFITSSGAYGALGLALCSLLLLGADFWWAIIAYDSPSITESLSLIAANNILSAFTVFGLVMLLRRFFPKVKPWVLFFAVMLGLAILPIFTGIAYNQTPYEEMFKGDLLSLNFTRLVGMVFMLFSLVELIRHYVKFHRNSLHPELVLSGASSFCGNDLPSSGKVEELVNHAEKLASTSEVPDSFATMDKLAEAPGKAPAKSNAGQKGFWAVILGGGCIDFEQLNCWSIKNMRQIFHRHGLLYGTVIALVLEIWLILVWDRSSYQNGNVFITMSIIYAAFLSLGCISFAVKRRSNFVGGMDDSVRHFMDFMVFKPGDFFRGIILNYTFLFVSQMLLLLPLTIVITESCNYKWLDIICFWVDGYLVGAIILFTMGLGKKIKSDIFAVGVISFIMLCELVDGRGGLDTMPATMLLLFVAFYAGINCLDSWVEESWRSNLCRRFFGIISGLVGFLILAAHNWDEDYEINFGLGVYLIMVGVIILSAASGGVLANPEQVRMALKERVSHKIIIFLGCTVSPIGFVLPWFFFTLFVLTKRQEFGEYSGRWNLMVIFAFTTIIAAALSTIIGNSISKFRRGESSINILQVILLFVIFFTFVINFSEQFFDKGNIMYDCMLIVALIASIVAQAMQWDYYKIHLSPAEKEEQE